MIFILKSNTDASKVVELVKSRSASYKVLDLYGRRIVVAWPDKLVENISDSSIELKVKPRHKFQLASMEWKDRTVVNVNGSEIGGMKVVVAAGPCAVEDEDQFIEIAKAVKRVGASIIRGGVLKPRTSPYTFQGIGADGLKILRKTKEVVGAPIVSEVMDTRDLVRAAEYIDMIQIGARNAQNYILLKEVGRIGKPVLLKRGFGMTVEE
ncbi:MAG: 3-deoxy-7-phosphoheptulonate synthase, partial [Desulfurococcaceae archaeon]